MAQWHVCLLAIYLPSFLLIIGILPFWETLCTNQYIHSALTRINATVVGLLLAAFIDLVWSSGVTTKRDFLLAITAFALLTRWKLASWLVVALTGLGGAILATL